MITFLPQARNMRFAFALLASLLLVANIAVAKERLSTEDKQYSDAATAVMNTRIGPKPSEAFYLADALESWGLADEAAGLRDYLMRQYLREVGGQAHDAKVKVGKAIDLGHQAGPLAYQGKDWFGTDWASVVRAMLHAAFADFSRPVPTPIAQRSPELREVAPGAWAGADMPNRREAIFLALEIENRSATAIPLGAFSLSLDPEPGSGIARFVFDCPFPADNKVTLVAGGGRRGVTCISSKTSSGKPAELARALIHVQAHPERALVMPADFDGRQSVRPEAIEAHRKALASLSAARLAPLLARFGKCARDNTCGEAKPRRDIRLTPAAWGFVALAFAVLYGVLAVFATNATAAAVLWGTSNVIIGWLITQGPSVATGESPAGIAYAAIYVWLAATPTIAVGILFLTVRKLQKNGWWIER